MANLIDTDNPVETIQILQAELQQTKDWLREANERIVRLTESGAQENFDYDLKQIAPESVCSRYDGIADGLFVFHEALSFEQFNGYDSSALYTWAVGSVSRAFGLDDMGRPLPGDLGNRCGDLPKRYVTDENGQTREVPELPCSNLPPFDKRLKLEVIVQVLPLDEVQNNEAMAV